MDPAVGNENLSQILTLWAGVRQAHVGGPASEIRDAQVRLLDRYSPAIRRFLHRALRDPDAAADVFHEFVIRFLFLGGAFQRADPGRGRFRDLLATALRNLVIDYERARKRQPLSLTGDVPDAEEAREEAAEALDREFVTAWREQLLALTWEALARHDERTKQPLCPVLRFHVAQPAIPSHEAAKQLGPLVGKAVSPEWVRKWLMRARERFVELFLDEAARGLPDASPEALEQDLLELGLLDMCRSELKRRRESILR